MIATLSLYSNEKGELNRFLSHFYDVNLDLHEHLEWKKEYQNPVELSEIIGVFCDNYNDYILSMWISLDKNVFINVTDRNANELIKYLYERFPY